MNSIRLPIVDDSSAMRKMVERALRMADVEIAQVFEAANGKEALAVLRDNTLDLILCSRRLCTRVVPLPRRKPPAEWREYPATPSDGLRSIFPHAGTGEPPPQLLYHPFGGLA